MGLVAGVLIPIGQIVGKTSNGFEFGPGQNGTIGAIFGILCGVLFFFIKNGTVHIDQKPRAKSIQDGGRVDPAITIVSAILIFTVIFQVMLVKSWT
jgi:hypothetical protein